MKKVFNFICEFSCRNLFILFIFSFLISCQHPKIDLKIPAPSSIDDYPLFSYTTQSRQNIKYFFATEIYDSFSNGKWDAKYTEPESFKASNEFNLEIEFLHIKPGRIILPRLIYSNYVASESIIKKSKLNKQGFAETKVSEVEKELKYTLTAYNNISPYPLNKKIRKKYLDLPSKIKKYFDLCAVNISTADETIDISNLNIEKCFPANSNITPEAAIVFYFRSKNIPSRLAYGYYDSNSDGVLNVSEETLSIEVFVENNGNGKWIDIPIVRTKGGGMPMEQEGKKMPSSSPPNPIPTLQDRHTPDIEEQNEGEKDKPFLEYRARVINNEKDIKRYYLEQTFSRYDPVRNRWSIEESNENYDFKFKNSKEIEVEATFDLSNYNGKPLILPKPFYSQFIKDSLEIRRAEDGTKCSIGKLSQTSDGIYLLTLHPSIKGIYKFKYKIKIPETLPELHYNYSGSRPSQLINLNRVPPEVKKAVDDAIEMVRENKEKEAAENLMVFVSSYIGYSSNKEIRKAVIEDYNPQGGRNFIEHILNLPYEKRYADCDVHNTVLAVLLQYCNIPARLAVGYIDGDSDGKISPSEGHGWTQVWINGQWIEYDATSARLRLKDITGSKKHWRKGVILEKILEVASSIDLDSYTNEQIETAIGFIKENSKEILPEVSNKWEKYSLKDKKELSSKINETIDAVKKELAKLTSIPGITAEQIAAAITPPKKLKIKNNDEIIKCLIEKFKETMTKNGLSPSQRIYKPILEKTTISGVQEVINSSVTLNDADYIFTLESSRIIGYAKEEELNNFVENSNIPLLFFRIFKKSINTHNQTMFKILKSISKNYFPDTASQEELNVQLINKYLAEKIDFTKGFSETEITQHIAVSLNNKPYSKQTEDIINSILNILDENEDKQPFRYEVLKSSAIPITYRTGLAVFIKNSPDGLELKKQLVKEAISYYKENSKEESLDSLLNLIASTYDSKISNDSYNQLKDYLNINHPSFHRFLVESHPEFALKIFNEIVSNDDFWGSELSVKWKNILYAIEMIKHSNSKDNLKALINTLNAYSNFIESIDEKTLKNYPYLLCIFDTSVIDNIVKSTRNKEVVNVLIKDLTILKKHLSLTSNQQNFTITSPEFPSEISFMNYSAYPFVLKKTSYSYKDFSKLFPLASVYSVMQTTNSGEIAKILRELKKEAFSFVKKDFNRFYDPLSLILSCDNIEKQIFNRYQDSDDINYLFNLFTNTNDTSKKTKIGVILSMYSLRENSQDTNYKEIENLSIYLSSSNHCSQENNIIFFNLCKPNYYTNTSHPVDDLKKYLKKCKNITIPFPLCCNKEKAKEFYGKMFTDENKNNEMENFNGKVIGCEERCKNLR